ncbi:Cro/CI family transcriptional regulator [Microbulbifer sp. 2205BS26-8]|uniref:Cro/CI family transcriptional regulator n=1 Tax=Microbulbifer sp. 2205BS26-8 TaxID=3064386 RepID=UPI0027401282|nr:Cro/CI family transcriptional regulator [Microbulbifer sp. 2205BS26-8]MDP5211185.1 Cro/CI family transcriptional regulator [Microbulbifer sp. 2205BS26-8]
MDIQTKQQARELFGTYTAIAGALEITKGAISQWPEHLPKKIRDRVMWAAHKRGLLDEIRDLPSSKKE